MLEQARHMEGESKKEPEKPENFRVTIIVVPIVIALIALPISILGYNHTVDKDALDARIQANQAHVDELVSNLQDLQGYVAEVQNAAQDLDGTGLSSDTQRRIQTVYNSYSTRLDERNSKASTFQDEMEKETKRLLAAETLPNTGYLQELEQDFKDYKTEEEQRIQGFRSGDLGPDDY